MLRGVIGDIVDETADSRRNGQAVDEMAKKLVVVVSFVVWVLIDFAKAHQLQLLCAPALGAVEFGGPPGDNFDLSSAKQAAEINVTGAMHYARGMRGIHMSLCSLAWLIGPAWFVAAAVAMGLVQVATNFSQNTSKLLIGSEMSTDRLTSTGQYAFATRLSDELPQRQRLLGRNSEEWSLAPGETSLAERHSGSKPTSGGVHAGVAAGGTCSSTNSGLPSAVKLPSPHATRTSSGRSSSVCSNGGSSNARWPDHELVTGSPRASSPVPKDPMAC